MPEGLPEPVHQMWLDLTAELEPRGLRVVELELIRMLCETKHRYLEARAEITRLGLLVRAQSGSPIVNPLLRVEKDAASAYVRLCYALDLIGSGWSRLEPPVPAPAADPAGQQDTRPVVDDPAPSDELKGRRERRRAGTA